ncbi:MULTISPECIES: class I adenylate-forming enzyme family protein [unclassified Cupriavidus]|uniref:class I adenylate-forming enzyme family protein n=1 Tax=Cupriavidus sp. H19C3 TaxID=3241603 RepID=UPI003BF92706
MDELPTRVLTHAYWPAAGEALIFDQTIGAALRMTARDHGLRTALIDGTPGPPRQRWSYDDLLTACEQVARALLARFAPGEHVAVWSANCPEWILLELGAALAGLVLVPVPPASTGPEVSHILRHSCARGVFAQPVHRGRNLLATLAGNRGALPALREVISLGDWDHFVSDLSFTGALPTPAPDDIAQIHYTSRHPGPPRGACLTHRSLANNSRLYARRLGARSSDVWINPLPLCQTMSCAPVTLGALQTGGTHVLLPTFDALLALSLLERKRGTIVPCDAAMLDLMLAHPEMTTFDLQAWRLVSLDTVPAADLLRRARRAFGVKVAMGFGQPESSLFLAHTLPDELHATWPDTVGRPMPGAEVKIVDTASGEIVPVHALGEICVRGAGTMRAYFADDSTDDAADGDDEADGWRHTGQLGAMDAHGYLRLHRA